MTSLADIGLTLVIIIWLVILAFFLGRLTAFMKELFQGIMDIHHSYHIGVYPIWVVITCNVIAMLLCTGASWLIYKYVTVPVNYFTETSAGVKFFQELDASPQYSLTIYLMYIMVHIWFFYLAIIKFTLDGIWEMINRWQYLRTIPDHICYIATFLSLCAIVIISSLFVFSEIMVIGTWFK